MEPRPMFFKKHREAKKHKAEETRRLIVEGFQQQFDAAAAETDPAERLLKLKDVTEAIDKLVKETRQKASEKSLLNLAGPYLAITGSTVGTTVLVVSALHFPPAAAMLALPSIFPGLWAGAANRNRALKKFETGAKPFFDSLEKIKTSAAEVSDAVLHDQLPALAGSAKLQTLLERCPNVREHFSEAFIRKAAAAPPAPKPGSGGLSL
jgi:hypothetical protein